MWSEYNPNPFGRRVGDCTVRAISAILNQPWEKTAMALAVEGVTLGDMQNANRTWGAYLERNGYRRHMVDSDCADCYTVRDFCRDHPNGEYVLAISGHVVAVRNGDWLDSWDSGDEIPIYYWKKEVE